MSSKEPYKINIVMTFQDKLIDVVKAHREVYDRRLKRKDKTFTRAIWEGVRKDMILAGYTTSVDDLMTHWKHLRDHFVRTKRIRDSTPQSDIKECEWQWWSQMQWMVPYIGRRIYQKKMSKPTSTGPNGDSHQSDKVMEDEEDDHPATSIAVPLPTVDAINVRVNKYRKRKKAGMITAACTNAKEAAEIAAEVISNKPIDELELFGKEVALELRKVSCDRQRAIIKRDIRNLLFDAIYQEDSTGNSSTSSTSIAFL